MSIQRRNLKFKKLADAVADAESLHRRGYDKAGQWDLSQVCGHLSEWMRYPIEGFPPAPFPVRVIMWGMRKTVGKKCSARSLKTASSPADRPPLKASNRPEATNRRPSNLRQAVDRFENHPGPFHPFAAVRRLLTATRPKGCNSSTARIT